MSCGQLQFTRIQIRRDIAIDWFNTNPTLASGELGYETDTGKLKVGDGVTPWNDLSYFDDQMTVYSDITGAPTLLSEFTNDVGYITLSELPDSYILPIASDTILGGIKVGTNLQIDSEGILSADITSLGNLTINDQTIGGTNVDGDITIAPNGIGYVAVTKLRLPVSTISESIAAAEVIVGDLILDATVDYSTGPDDHIPQNTYGIHNQINAPWTVYRVTTNPSPVLQEYDIIAGGAIPVGSAVRFIGTGIYENIIVTDITITGPVPTPGTTILIARPYVNAALAIATDPNTDVSLIAGPNGRVIISSHIIPTANDSYDLGTPAKRFRRLWMGAGSIFVQDETTGGDLRITAIGGDLVIAGGAGLSVGEFRFHDNQLFLNNPDREILIGTTGATAPVTFKRTIQVRNITDEYDLLNVNQQGRLTILSDIATDPTEAAMSIVGARTRDVQSPNNLGVLLHLTGSSTAPSRIYHDSYGAANYSAFIGRHGRGNSLNPSQTLTGDIISRIGANPYKETSFSSISTMRMDFVVTEDQTDIAQGNEIQLWTTAIGDSSIQKRVSIDDTGIILKPLGNGGITFADSTRQTTAWQDTISYNNVTDIPDLSVYQLIDTAFSGSWNDLTEKPTNVSYWSNDAGYLTSASSLAWNKLTGIPSLINSVAASTGITVSTVGGVATIGNSGILSVAAGSAGAYNGINGQIGVSNVGQNITLTLPQGISTTSNVEFHDVTITGLLSVADFTLETAPTIAGKILYLASDATVENDISGGGIWLGPIAETFSRSFLYNLEFNRWDTDGAGLNTLELAAADIYIEGQSHFGNAYTQGQDFNNAIVQIDANNDDYVQVALKNHSSGLNASSDFIAMNDLGTDTNHYIDIGINSSTYSNIAYSISGPNDGYLYVVDGDLTIGTATANKVIKLFTGDTTAESLRVTIDDAGMAVIGDISATTFIGNLNGNADTVTNGVYTDSSYNNPSWITSLDYSKIANHPNVYSSAYIGTTSISFNRASGALSLTGVSIDGNAGTVTNGVYTSGDQTISGTKTFSSTITGSITGNAGTVTNGIYSTGSYANPSWITSLDYSKISNHPAVYSSAYIGTTSISFNRASGPQNLTGINIDGNAGTVTNGVYTNGSYSNPSWITGLAYTKISGAPTSLSAFSNDPAYITNASLSVSTQSATNGGSLSYTGGVFTYRPADLSTYATQTYVTSQGYITTSGLSVSSQTPSGSTSTLTYTGGVFTFTSAAAYSLPTASTLVLGGVKVDGTSITINGSGVISATSSGGTVTSVAALTIGSAGIDISSTVANSTTTPVITLNIPTASASNRGALSSSDWSLFNGKGNGTVTSIATSGSVSGITLTGGTITSSGTITLGGSLSLTSLQVTTALGYTPGTGNGTVTNVSALTIGTTGTDITSTVASSSTTPVITLNIPTASASNRGALSAADWTAFNSKGNGTVTSVATSGSVNGITLTGGTITTTGTVTLGGTLSGIANNQLTNSTISGVALGGSLSNLTAGTAISFSSGTTYNGSAAITINNAGVTALTTSTGLSVNTNATGSVTVTNTDLGSSQNIFKNIAVSGQTTVTATINNDTATFVAGTGMGITTSGKNVTFTNTSASTRLAYKIPSTFSIGLSKNTQYSIFGLTNGVLLETDTVYQYEAVFNIQRNASTDFSYNLKLGTGTVLARHDYTVQENHTTTSIALVAGITMMSNNVTTGFNSPVVVANIGNNFGHFIVWGTIDVTTGGYVDFMCQLSAGQTTFNNLAGGYIKLLPLGPSGTIGTWS